MESQQAARPVPADPAPPPAAREARRLVDEARAALQRRDPVHARAALAAAARLAPDVGGDEYAYLLRGLARRQAGEGAGAATLALLEEAQGAAQSPGLRSALAEDVAALRAGPRGRWGGAAPRRAARGVLGAVALAALAAVGWGAAGAHGAREQARSSATATAQAAATGTAVAAALARATAAAAPTATAAAAAQATATAAAAQATATVRAEAVGLLGAAGAEREAGRLEPALGLAGQALDRWPGYPDAAGFVATVGAQATQTATARPPVTLPSGTQLLPVAGPFGQSTLRIQNGTDRDAAVKLVDADGRTRRFVYVQATSEATLDRIAPGTYTVRFTQGLDWDTAANRFQRTRSFSEFEDPFVFEVQTQGTVTTATGWRVTLHAVPGGTAETDPISEEQFGKD